MAKILIIDDSVAISSLLKMHLGAHTFRDARDGQEGLSVARDFVPDVIFLDIQMPKLDGWDTCRQLKNSPLTRHIPVIMLTSCKEEIEQLRSFESGADEFLSKPWNPSEVSLLVDRLTGNKAA